MTTYDRVSATVMLLSVAAFAGIVVSFFADPKAIKLSEAQRIPLGVSWWLICADALQWLVAAIWRF